MGDYIAPNANLLVVSMQPGHADALYHTALTQIACHAINNIGNRYAKERK